LRADRVGQARLRRRRARDEILDPDAFFVLDEGAPQRLGKAEPDGRKGVAAAEGGVETADDIVRHAEDDDLRRFAAFRRLRDARRRRCERRRGRCAARQRAVAGRRGGGQQESGQRCCGSGFHIGAFTTSMTAYACTGFPNPLRTSAPRGTAVTISSTSASTRWLTTIWPGRASSQRRDARLHTLPTAP